MYVYTHLKKTLVVAETLAGMGGQKKKTGAVSNQSSKYGVPLSSKFTREHEGPTLGKHLRIARIP